MKRISKRKKLTAIVLLSLFTVLAALYTVFEPQSAPGYALFRVRYGLALDKGAMLSGYDRDLWRFNGGYIPARTDGFLGSRLGKTSSEAEFSGIVDFYATKAGGRETDILSALPTEVQARVAAYLMTRLESDEPEQARRTLRLLEGLRRGRMLFKGGIGPADLSGGNTWWEDQGHSIVRQRFRQWWQKSGTWEEKRRHDPLAGSGIQFGEL